MIWLEDYVIQPPCDSAKIYPAVMRLIVSTAAELPVKGAVIGEKRVLPFSSARVVQEGKRYMLDDNGQWYEQQP